MSPSRAANITNGQLEAAAADLADVRASLLAAAQGEVDARDLKDSLLGYVQEHGPVLRSAAVAVGDQIRGQLLEQLYGWRAQLADQLGSRRAPPDTSLR